MQAVFLGEADRAVHLMRDFGDVAGRLAGADFRGGEGEFGRGPPLGDG